MRPKASSSGASSSSVQSSAGAIEGASVRSRTPRASRYSTDSPRCGIAAGTIVAATRSRRANQSAWSCRRRRSSLSRAGAVPAPRRSWAAATPSRLSCSATSCSTSIAISSGVSSRPLVSRRNRSRSASSAQLQQPPHQRRAQQRLAPAQPDLDPAAADSRAVLRPAQGRHGHRLRQGRPAPRCAGSSRRSSGCSGWSGSASGSAVRAGSSSFPLPVDSSLARPRSRRAPREVSEETLPKRRLARPPRKGSLIAA